MAALIPPTYEDATLVLRLYELRREDRLRAAREWRQLARLALREKRVRDRLSKYTAWRGQQPPRTVGAPGRLDRAIDVAPR